MQQIVLMNIFMWLNEVWSRYPNQSKFALRQVDKALTRLQRSHDMPPQKKLDFKNNCDRARDFLNESASLSSDKEDLNSHYNAVTRRYQNYHFRGRCWLNATLRVIT